ncbi:Glyoxylase, beta-lactamase superfamily II [Nakamurella panacisegetis]|uniref:Glyoxylase, beta-lactamase superfamily II n=1 Tax=Nakamurella panacisegetis TaxID=1090615 RepID=A0A1H0J367_9ACTN|nr:MBL fold metallo-hydrolase [Nakamurella panacisegetis]SDO38165.1 Glyoxylase, beta-lactamase superfamily II [Nakamurella panacisegetis]
MRVEVIDTSELGDRSYVVHDGRTAIVVDPQRDVDRVEAILATKALSCEAVLETHIHNDYVTGGYVLAQRTGGAYVLSGADPVDFDRVPVEDGAVLNFGALRVRVIATPGHTDTHLAYVVDQPGSADSPAVFTGGSLLFGSVGRTDLVDPARTEELTHAQYHSARRLSSMLDPDVPVYPTHGFGSFCSSGSATGGDSSTIGAERARNDALTAADEEGFVAALIANLTAYPAYYAHMAPLNRQGPTAMDLSAPKVVGPQQLPHLISAGDWVVDLRERTAYAASHLDGTISIALGAQFATYLGWLMPWGENLTLLGETAEQITDAQRQLARIGIDRPDGAAVGAAEYLAAGRLSSYPRVSFPDAAHALGLGHTHDHGHPHGHHDRNGQVVLDVRRDDERAVGFIPGSAHIPLHSLLARLDEVPPGRLWVHCASGFRASIAASLLARAGREVMYIDDTYDTAVAMGLTSTRIELQDESERDAGLVRG